jgi:hypothetical protein
VRANRADHRNCNRWGADPQKKRRLARAHELKREVRPDGDPENDSDERGNVPHGIRLLTRTLRGLRFALPRRPNSGPDNAV